MKMKFSTVSIFVIGTELTCGIIQDKHISLLSSELTHMGYSVKRAVIVPDDGTIEAGLESAILDSDILLVTGGLGPTSDDLTRQIIADIAHVPLEKNDIAWKEVYARLGERIWGANEKQAYIPKGFEEIPNPKGTAPGFKGFFKPTDMISVDLNGGDSHGADSHDADSHRADSHGADREVLLVAMPGPPVEMQYMFFNHVRPFLAKLSGHENLERDEFSVYLVPEAKLEDVCEKCAVDGVQWGTRFQQFKISLYVSGPCKEKREEFETRLMSALGNGLMVPGELDAVDSLTHYLEDNNLTISTSESCTCGLIAKMLTDRSGSSKWYWGGACTYANEAKTAILGVSPTILADSNIGPVSPQCAIQMAEGTRKLSHTNIAVSITGIAGPQGAEEGKPVGTAYLGFSSSFRETEVVRVNISPNSRDAARRRFSTAAMILALEYAKGFSVVDMVKSWVYI